MHREVSMHESRPEQQQINFSEQSGSDCRIYIHTPIYYCCRSVPVLLHDVMVGEWIASCVFILFFGPSVLLLLLRAAAAAACCCCCCPQHPYRSGEGYRLLFLPSQSRLLLLLFPLGLFYCCCCCREGICIFVFWSGCCCC